MSEKWAKKFPLPPIFIFLLTQVTKKLFLVHCCRIRYWVLMSLFRPLIIQVYLGLWPWVMYCHRALKYDVTTAIATTTILSFHNSANVMTDGEWMRWKVPYFSSGSVCCLFWFCPTFVLNLLQWWLGPFSAYGDAYGVPKQTRDPEFLVFILFCKEFQGNLEWWKSQ